MSGLIYLFILGIQSVNELESRLSIWKNEQASDGDEEITQKSAQREK